MSFWLAALLPLAVYLLTLHRGLPAGDSGELIAVAHGLGIAHPPGYPLWTLLAHAFGKAFALGEYCWRINVSSALMQAIACGVFATALRRCGVGRRLAVAGAWMLGFTPAIWKNALVAEVFPLNTLLATLLLLGFVRVAKDARDAFGWGLMCFVGASTLVHHHTLLLWALPLWIAALPWLKAIVRPRNLLAATALLLLALAPLLYLFFRVPAPGVPWWGETQSWEGLSFHLLRRDYGMLSLDPEQSGYSADRSHLLLYLQSWPGSFGLGLLGLLGLPWALAGWRRLFAAMGLFAILQIWFFTRVGFPSQPALFRGVVERFYMLPHVVVAAALVLGLNALMRRAPARTHWAAFLLPLPMLWHWTSVDQSRNRYVDELLENMLASAPADAVLFTVGDLFHNGLAVKQEVEGLRPDLRVVDQELLTKTWYTRRLREHDPDLLPDWPREGRYSGAPETLNLLWLDHLRGRRDVFFLGVKEQSYAEGYELVPRGLLYQAFPKDSTPGVVEQLDWQSGFLREARFSQWLRDQDPWSFEFAERERVALSLERICLLLCQPEGQAVRVAQFPELVKLRELLRQHAALAQPWPFLRRAAGYVSLYHPDLEDSEFARTELGAALNSGAPMPDRPAMERLLRSLDQRNTPSVDSPRTP